MPRVKTRIELPHNFSPRSYQVPIFEAYRRGIRRFITTWHRRGGKDVTWLHFTACRMVERVGMYWFVAPTYEMTKNILWLGRTNEGVHMLDVFPPELIEGTNNSDLLITLKNGSMLKLIGSEDVNRLVGTNAVGMVFSEAALQKPEVWELLRPIILANNGWAAFNSTPRGRGWFYDFWQAAQASRDWYTSILDITQTRRDAEGEDGRPIITEEQIEQIRAEGADEDLVQQEYYCSFSGAFVGSYYGKILGEMEKGGRVREVIFEPTLPVYTVWDLGVADSTAIWFAQNVGREVHLIDYYEASGQGLAHFAKEVHARPYVYSTHWAPHDIEVRELGTGVSRKETAMALRIHFRVVPNIPVQDGIDAVRVLLPRCFFDRNKCDSGLRSLQNYSKEWDAKNGQYKDHPRHDKWSHGADAFRYLALIAERENSVYVPQQASCVTDYDIFADPKEERQGNAGFPFDTKSS